MFWLSGILGKNIYFRDKTSILRSDEALILISCSFSSSEIIQELTATYSETKLGI